jgi:hypothetical protein
MKQTDDVHTLEATYLLGAEIEQPGIPQPCGCVEVQELIVSLVLSGDIAIADVADAGIDATTGAPQG